VATVVKEEWSFFGHTITTWESGKIIGGAMRTVIESPSNPDPVEEVKMGQHGLAVPHDPNTGDVRKVGEGHIVSNGFSMLGYAFDSTFSNTSTSQLSFTFLSTDPMAKRFYLYDDNTDDMYQKVATEYWDNPTTVLPPCELNYKVINEVANEWPRSRTDYHSPVSNPQSRQITYRASKDARVFLGRGNPSIVGCNANCEYASVVGGFMNYFVYNKDSYKELYPEKFKVTMSVWFNGTSVQVDDSDFQTRAEQYGLANVYQANVTIPAVHVGRNIETNLFNPLYGNENHPLYNRTSESLKLNYDDLRGYTNVINGLVGHQISSTGWQKFDAVWKTYPVWTTVSYTSNPGCIIPPIQ
jgi:hypothetical protein